MRKSAYQLTTNNYLDITHGRFKHGQVDGTTPKQLDDLFKTLTQSGSDHLVIHFHGGLVSRKTALAEAQNLGAAYDAGHAYPVFFIWNSDLLTDLQVHIHASTRQKWFLHLVQRVLWYSVYGKSSLKFRQENMPDTLPGLEKWAQARERKEKFVATPLSAAQQKQIKAELTEDKVLIRDSHRIAAASPKSSHVAPHIRKRLIQDWAKGISDARTLVHFTIPVISMVMQRLRDHRDHHLYTTVLEEVLVQICHLDRAVIIPTWDQMKQDTQDAFIQDPLKYGGWAFLKQLKKWWQPRRNPQQRITLVGHSAGAIFITNFLAAAQKVIDTLQVDVVFLAPACSYEYLNKNLQAFKKQVTHLRMFALKNEIEEEYWEVPYVYKGSLLYIISSLCESANRLNEEDVPIVGMQRYYKAQGPYKNIRSILNVTGWLAGNSGPDLVWAPTAANSSPGKQSNAQKHGEFSTDPVTLNSLTYIVASGYR